MNKVILMGRLTKDPDIRWTSGEESKCVGRFTIAVDRRTAKEGQQAADFINCVAFGKTAEFCEKYAKKGTKFVVEGRIQTGSYTNQNNIKVHTTDVLIESMEFAESKKASGGSSAPEPKTDDTGFMNIPEGMEEELPFV